MAAALTDFVIRVRAVPANTILPNDGKPEPAPQTFPADFETFRGNPTRRSAAVPEQSPATGVAKRSRDKRYPILEGVDQEAAPYEVVSVPSGLRRTRSRPQRERSVAPMVMSLLVVTLLVGVFAVGWLTFRSTAPRNGVSHVTTIGGGVGEKTREPSEPAPKGRANNNKLPHPGPNERSIGKDLTVSSDRQDKLGMQPESKTDDKPGAAARNSGIRLFNGKDSTRWITRNGNTNNWSVENGILKADGGKDPNARNFLCAKRTSFLRKLTILILYFDSFPSR